MHGIKIVIFVGAKNYIIGYYRIYYRFRTPDNIYTVESVL